MTVYGCTRLTLEAALHMSATILPATRVSKMFVVAKLNTFSKATCLTNVTNVSIYSLEIMGIVEWSVKRLSVDLEDVQRALCEDGAEGGRQAELYQTLQMSHFLRFGFFTSLFQSAAVYQGKASVDKCLDFLSNESKSQWVLLHLSIL